MRSSIQNYLKQLEGGGVCLHPGDTIPGLTCDPRDERAIDRLKNLKGREQGQPFLGLVASVECALSLWQPLPERSEQALALLWPGNISVVWAAKPSVPRYLVSRSGEIGLRVFECEHQHAWFKEILTAVPLPLPTTSVNLSGTPAARSWGQASEFAQNHRVFIPDSELLGRMSSQSGEASTIIRLLNDGQSYEVIRAGAMSPEDIDRKWSEAFG